MKPPSYLVIHTCILSFFHHLIQKLSKILILDFCFYPRIEDISTCTKWINNNPFTVCFLFFSSQIPVINKLLLVVDFQHYFQSFLRLKIHLLISLSILVPGLSWKKFCCPLMNYYFLFLIVQFPIPSLCSSEWSVGFLLQDNKKKVLKFYELLVWGKQMFSESIRKN